MILSTKRPGALRPALAAFLLWAGAGWGAPLSSGADFLLMTTGARPDGMGQAFSAVADDINTLSFNPAGLGNIRLPEVGYGYERFVGEIDYNFLGGAVPLGPAGVLGLGYVEMGTAPFNSTADPSATPGTAQDQAFIAGWGRSFYDLHVGASAKYILRRLDGVQGDGWAFDVGFRYRILPNLTFAGSAMDLGAGVRMASLETLPTVLNAGFAWTPLEQGDHTLSLALNGLFDLASNTQALGAGMEYWFQDTLALRGGYEAQSRDTAFTTNGLSAGAGVRVAFLQLDYAFQPFNTLGVIHRFSGILRWEGPWASGGEPDPPKYVSVKARTEGLEVRWERPQGPSQGYQVLFQPLDGGERVLSPVVRQPIYVFKDARPDTLYSVSVRTLNEGQASFPSPASFALSAGYERPPEGFGGAGERVSVRNWVSGEVDGVGLCLSWDPDPDSKGYQLYRRSPSGQVVKVTRVPRRSNRLWVTDTSGLSGWSWYVTSISRTTGRERTLGFFLWFPTDQETETLAQAPLTKLHAEAEPGHRMFLDWNQAVPAEEGYSLFLGDVGDGVLERVRDFPSSVKTTLLQIPYRRDKILFLVAPKDGRGRWSQRSNLEAAEFLIWEPGDRKDGEE